VGGSQTECDHPIDYVRSGEGNVYAVIVADADSLWLIAAAIALSLGILGFGLNYNLRKNRASAEKDAEVLRKEVRRMRSTQSSEALTEAELRQRALEEALIRNPRLAEATDSDSVRELQRIVDEITEEMRLRHQVAELKAKQDAERQREETARQMAAQRAAAQREAEERARVADELEKQAKAEYERHLAAMSPARRWIFTHRSTVLAGVATLVLVVAGGSWFAVNFFEQRQRDQVAAEAAAAAAAEREAQAALEAEQRQAEFERIEELKKACDLTQAGEDTPQEVWFEWINCEDETVVAAALNKVPSSQLNPQLLIKLARETRNEEVAREISSISSTPPAAHEALVERWSPEVVGTSYVRLYNQECSTGVEPKSYVGDTVWLESGMRVVFSTDNCQMREQGGQIIRISGGVPARWAQNGLVVSIGPIPYLLEGNTLRPDPDSPWADYASTTDAPTYIRAE
jgi:hypothetical protein